MTPRPKLVSIAPDAGTERYIAVDAEGHVWHGRLKSERGEHYIEWTPFRSEFQGV
jgi:hypothetical protein